MVEMNGGHPDSSAYKSNPIEDRQRHERMALILMFIARSFNLKNWYEITAENYLEWVEKIFSLSPTRQEVYKVFSQKDLNEKLEMY